MGKDSSNTGCAKTIRVAAIALIVTVILMLFVQQGFRLLTGRSLGLGLWRIKHLGLAILDHKSVTNLNHSTYANVIFLHHSTGGNLISQGGVRERFTEAGYDFWDHHYNQTGLRRPDGSNAGYSYRIPGDNTDPGGLADIFAQPVYALPLNALSGLLQHEVIVFKSCFPASHIVSDEQLEQYKTWYLGMRDTMDAHPERVFVVMSPPPLNPVATTPEAAARARTFADWLTSPEYLDGHPNVFAFDFFDQLAQDDPAALDYNMLRASYRDGENSHPNQAANQTVGPLFAEAVMVAARDYCERRGFDTATE